MARLQKTISPIDDSVFVERELANPAQIEQALKRAAQAQTDWKQRSIAQRAEFCNRFTDAFVAKRTDIAEEITRQMGRPIRSSPSEVSGLEERARYMTDIAEFALADVEVGEKSGFTRFIRREPLGVALTIAPWNYPYLTAVNSIIPALMAGNSVVLKHSAQTPLCAERFLKAFQEAGLPEDVFQILHMDHVGVEQAIKNPHTAFVAFTGSVTGGHAVQQAAAGRFIGLGLELGGKDPAYVRHDANLDHAVENLVDGAMFNSGQSCCGIERIYVHKTIFQRFVEGYVDLTRQYRLGNPLDQNTNLGPMVRTSAAEFVRGQIHDAVAAGAKALIDPKSFSADQAGTPYLAPQVLTGVDHSMRVMSEESFGPVIGIMAVDSDEHAIQLMNDSEYGLTAAIWTQDEEAALRIGDQINTGTWFMNRCDYLDPALAWTGVKNSGRGCSLSSVGYEHLTRPKSFHFRTVT